MPASADPQHLSDVAIVASVMCFVFCTGCLTNDAVLEKHSNPHGIWLKCAASAMYLVAALCWNAIGNPECPVSESAADVVRCLLQTDAGSARFYMFASLVLCFVGDVLLLFHEFFLSGLVAFLLGHLGFVAVFATRNLDAQRFLVYGLVPITVFGLWVRSWLFHRAGKMLVPVAAYLVIILSMVGTAIAGSHGWVSVAAAVMFLLSDIGVARNRFIARTLVNRATLALYYAATLLFAALMRDPAF
jgi:uncharacterized membrane protein YhhN